MFTRRSAFFSELPRAKRTMKHRHFAKFVALVVVGFVSCRESPRTAATQGATAAPQQFSRSDQLLFAAARIGLPPEGVAPGDLPEPNSPRAQLLVTYCAQCHALPAPTQHSATDWPSVARRTWLRMEWLPEALGVRVPTNAERYEMLQYLTLNALKVSGSVLPAGRGR